MEINRRKFFSFFGTGVAMLAKPDLFVPDTSMRLFTMDDLRKIEISWRGDPTQIDKWKAALTIGPSFLLAT